MFPSGILSTVVRIVLIDLTIPGGPEINQILSVKSGTDDEINIYSCLSKKDYNICIIFRINPELAKII